MTAPPASEYGTAEWLERCLFERTHEPVLCTSCYPAPYHDHKRIVAYRNRCQVCGGTGVVWQPVDEAEVEAALERFGS